MSLSDIVQFVGTGSVPVVVAGTVLGVFELGEKLASQKAKDALSNWLLTFDVRKAGALPDGTQELFAKIFGERHFSLKCFVRSAAFSLGAIAFIGILLFLISPEKIFQMNGLFQSSSTWLALGLWLPWSILIDYLSLFKTRFILGVLTRMGRRNEIIAIIIVGLDYIVYRLLFGLGVALIELTGSAIEGTLDVIAWHQAIDIVIRMSFGQQGAFLPFIPHDIDLPFILFWAGLAPFLWAWLYVAASFVTRALFRSERIVNFLRWVLDVEKNPFRSIGAVAAALAFIASVAIILISAEVSRISTAA